MDGVLQTSETDDDPFQERRSRATMKHTNKDESAPQNGEIYDVLDLRLALLDLNKRGFDLHVSAVADDANRLQVTCNKTHILQLNVWDIENGRFVPRMLKSKCGPDIRTNLMEMKRGGWLTLSSI
jgi:hypothetical protein